MPVTRIVAEAGSCHLNSLPTAKKLIDAAADAGAWAVKFQWLDEGSVESGNNAGIFIPEKWIPRLKAHADKQGVELFFSCFGVPAIIEWKMGVLARDGIKYMKFAFPQRHLHNLHDLSYDLFKETFISHSPMDLLPDHPTLRRLYCHSVHGQAVYPVETWLDWEGIFPPFHGFSDHSKGKMQAIQALIQGATILEKHIRLDDTPMSIPDARIAIPPSVLSEICEHARLPNV